MLDWFMIGVFHISPTQHVQKRTKIKFATKNEIKTAFIFQVENLEELLKEKDNQVDIARTKLSAVQAQTFSSEGTVTSLEEALTDRDKQINQLREQRDRAEKEVKEEKELHEREITDYKMKLHSVESEVKILGFKKEFYCVPFPSHAPLHTHSPFPPFFDGL